MSMKMNYQRRAPRWPRLAKYEPSAEVVARAAERRAKAKRETEAGIKTVEKRQGEGARCPQCSQVMELRMHTTTATAKLRRKPYYFSKWSICLNPNCKQQMPVTRDEDIVWRHDVTPSEREQLQAGIAPPTSKM